MQKMIGPWMASFSPYKPQKMFTTYSLSFQLTMLCGKLKSKDREKEEVFVYEQYVPSKLLQQQMQQGRGPGWQEGKGPGWQIDVVATSVTGSRAPSHADSDSACDRASTLSAEPVSKTTIF